MLPEAVDTRLLTPVCLALLMFGIVYAIVIFALRNYMRRWSALAVMFGVGANLFGLFAFDPRWALLFFSVSGTPMVIGNIFKVEFEEALDRRKVKSAVGEDQ
jgi:hypothetical protein